MAQDDIAFRSGKWRGRVAGSQWAEIFRDLDAWLAQNPGEMVVHYVSRDVRRISTALGVVYLKDIRALTDAGLLGKDRFSWMKWVFRGSRAIETWDASMALQKAGLLCPKPILAVRRRKGIIPQDLFISQEVPYPNLWDAIPNGMDDTALAEMLAREIHKMHQEGFVHGDCILRNLCYAPEHQQAVFLDNDRTWSPPAFLRKHLQKRNLAQMCYSILKRFDETPARLFLDCYAGISHGISKPDIEKILSAAIDRRDRKKARK